MSTHRPPVLAPYDDISKMAKPISIFLFHHGTFFPFYWHAGIWNVMETAIFFYFFFASLAEVFVRLLAQIRFEN